MKSKEGASSSLLWRPPGVPDCAGTNRWLIAYLVNSLLVSMDFDAPSGTLIRHSSLPGFMAFVRWNPQACYDDSSWLAGDCPMSLVNAWSCHWRFRVFLGIMAIVWAHFRIFPGRHPFNSICLKGIDPYRTPQQAFLTWGVLISIWENDTATPHSECGWWKGGKFGFIIISIDTLRLDKRKKFQRFFERITVCSPNPLTLKNGELLWKRSLRSYRMTIWRCPRAISCEESVIFWPR